MNMPSIEEAKKDLEIIEREIVLLSLIKDSATELSTHADTEGDWYKGVSMRVHSHLISAVALKNHTKKEYNL